MEISSKLAKNIGNKLGIDWNEINLEEFRMGLETELEHGSKLGPKTDVTHNDLTTTGKIALAHLVELPNYYTKLKTMEKNESVKEHIMSSERFKKLAGLLKE